MEATAYAPDAGQRCIALRAQWPLVSQSARRTWVHMATVGEWKGHPAGPFTLTPETFDAVIAQFAAEENALPVKLEHPDAADDNRAVGWIHEMARRGDDLWANVEFTERGAGMVASGEYRFCSVWLEFETPDPVSGEPIPVRLRELGLTNNPFLLGLNPIQLTRARGGATARALAAERTKTMTDMELLKEAAKVLGPDATLDKVVKWVEAKKAVLQVESGEEAAPAEGDAPPPDEAAASDDVTASAVPAAEVEAAAMDAVEPAADQAAMEDMGSAVVASLAEMLGADEATTVALMQENLEAVAAVLQGAPASGTEAESMAAAGLTREANATITKLSREVKSASEKADALARELAEVKLTHRIDTAVREGVIVEAQREWCAKLGRANPALLDEHLAAAEKSPAVPKATVTASRRPNGAAEAPEYDRSHPRYAGLEETARGLGLPHLRDAESRHRWVCNRIHEIEARTASRSI